MAIGIIAFDRVDLPMLFVNGLLSRHHFLFFSKAKIEAKGRSHAAYSLFDIARARG